MPKRKGATRPADVPKTILQQLNRGDIETANLSESLAMDFSVLLAHLEPKLKKQAKQIAEGPVTKRMALAGQLLFEHYGAAGYEKLIQHPSDIVRSWAAYVLAQTPELSLKQRLQKIKPLADDAHFGVREWAWIAVRDHIAADLPQALQLFEPWVRHTSPFIRRFAIESTRPRGVWCKHIPVLKEQPELALPLLEPLSADTEKYVQDSVANWLNDAGKTQADWVKNVCSRWQKQSHSPHTARICKRAQRNL